MIDQNRLPSAIGIGCRRCASSWLHSALNQHSEIRKPVQGLHFFSEHFNRGLDWYMNEMPEGQSGKCSVEFSVSYMYPEYAELCAERIAALVPSARLFVVLRNPIDRAFSDYLRSNRRLEIPTCMDFDDAINRFPEFLERGLYGKLLQPYFSKFANDQICVLRYEDVVRDPRAFLVSLLGHIETSRDTKGIDLDRRDLAAGSVRSVRFTSTIFSTRDAINAIGRRVFSHRWPTIKNIAMPVYRRLLGLNTGSATISNSTRRDLAAYYQPDIVTLSKLVRRDFSEWL